MIDANVIMQWIVKGAGGLLNMLERITEDKQALPESAIAELGRLSDRLANVVKAQRILSQ